MSHRQRQRLPQLFSQFFIYEYFLIYMNLGIVHTYLRQKKCLNDQKSFKRMNQITGTLLPRLGSTANNCNIELQQFLMFINVWNYPIIICQQSCTY